MIAIVDFGVGNLFSLKSSFSFIKREAVVSSDPDVIKSAERVVLPGVGAFADAAARLREKGLDRAVCECAAAGTPILGICLGMQLLFERSLEYGSCAGLSLIKGEVRPIEEIIPKGLKIPHIGWNRLKFVGPKHPVFKYVNDGEFVYFVHSYHGCGCGESLAAVTEYGAELTAAVASGSVCGCQFHPEKSGETGLNILRGFCEWEAAV